MGLSKAVTAVVLAIASLTACDHESDVLKGAGSSGVTGTVVDRRATGKGFWLRVEEGSGHTVKVFVRRSTYKRCATGEPYPACASG